MARQGATPRPFRSRNGSLVLVTDYQEMTPLLLWPIGVPPSNCVSFRRTGRTAASPAVAAVTKATVNQVLLASGPR